MVCHVCLLMVLSYHCQVNHSRTWKCEKPVRNKENLTSRRDKKSCKYRGIEWVRLFVLEKSTQSVQKTLCSKEYFTVIYFSDSLSFQHVWNRPCVFWGRYPVSGILLRRSAQAVTTQLQDGLPELRVRGRLQRPAYLDWKYRNGKKDVPKWHQEFIDHMRENAGLMCNWQKPFRGIFDTVVLLSLMLLVSVIMPIIVWGSYFFPLVYMVDYLFGDILTADDECDKVPHDRRNPASFLAYQITTRKTLKIMLPSLHRKVTAVWLLWAQKLTLELFATLITLFVSLSLSYDLLSKRVQRFRSVLYFLSSFCGLLFAFSFIPFFMFYFFDRTPLWTWLLVFMLSIVEWLFFPVLRRKFSFVVVVYLYSYAVYWKVYQSTLFGITYSDYLPVCLLHHFMNRACVRSNTATTGVCL